MQLLVETWDSFKINKKINIHICITIIISTLRKLIDLVIRTKDEKGRVRVWHKEHIDLDKLVYKVDEEYNLLPEYEES